MLSLLIALPLVGALAVALLPQRLSKPAGLGVALVTLAISLVAAAQYQLDGGMQFTYTADWIEALGVHYAVGLDGLGLLMVLLTTVLVPIVLVAEWLTVEDESGRGPRSFIAWTLALEALSLAVFTATDVFLFYVVFEATLIPAYFLVGGFGRDGRGAAALKFLMFQLAGGLVLLAAVIGLYVVSAEAGEPSYLLTDLAALDIGTEAGRWLFAGFFFAFAVKAPLFPVHTWLADTTEKATPGTSTLLVCVLDKIGTFGMLRFCLGLFPEASQWATPLVITLALVSIVYGALLAIGQDDVLRLIGLTSLSHFGFITLGIFAFTTQGGSGAILYMVNHGLATAGLFLLAGYVYHRSGTMSIREMGGMEKVTPVLAGLFLIAGLATLGLPGLSPFISEFLVLLSAFDYAWWAGAVAVTGIVLAAIYVLWLYQRTMTGPTTPAVADAKDLGVRELAAVVPLVAALVFFGFFPGPLLDVSNPMIGDLLTEVGVSDDPPVVSGEHASGEEAH
ncbi:NADH-quinone oxidoreductase subunit M [Nocardioides panacisoli]|uniref:NADH-quinone oxidoreductase subunit M n=1 Tax=Nocardioides panacisoli TaxID=627624 RepID=UPI001C630ECF|nr:NADH-quinone oxidoreductase subunit M [Nocardioides panacisoli]QYJ03811.1 NADH-quinone oxidoreductase subunit M [Nocardioides panacisoli]